MERRGEICSNVHDNARGDMPKPSSGVYGRQCHAALQWEPMADVFPKPISGRGGRQPAPLGDGCFRRISDEKPFGDLIASSPTEQLSRKLRPSEPDAASVSAKLVRGVFRSDSGGAGSVRLAASTLAACGGCPV